MEISYVHVPNHIDEVHTFIVSMNLPQETYTLAALHQKYVACKIDRTKFYPELVARKLQSKG